MYNLDTGQLHFQGNVRGHLRHRFQLSGADRADGANGRGGAASTATVNPRRSTASTVLIARYSQIAERCAVRVGL